MTRRRTREAVKHLSHSDLDSAIKKERRRARIIPRLIFIRMLYGGKSVPEASAKMKITKRLGYIWLERWNSSGVEGLVPTFSPGGPTKLGSEQLKELKEYLSSGSWTTGQVRNLIKERFGVEYSSRQVARILRRFRMNHGKPYPHDYRRPKDAEERLKKTDRGSPEG